ncbi:MAG: hypothetical protein KF878_14175 [Planctomycetes bacterium]|nr:hypothetical protein [Planctomycetota bacterium]
MKRRRVFGATIWDLVEAFYEAKREFHEVYVLYETRVLAHAEERSVDRRRLRLDATEVSKLLDFTRLGGLRNGPLHRAKWISHSLFRSRGRTHKFDRHISEIFHELSILREEQYKVSTFAEDYRRENELEEYESLLDEVHEDFPRRVNQLHELFRKAQLSLEGVLRAHSRDPVYLRSLCLFGERTLRDAYPEGVTSHLWRVFARGPIEAFMLAARSFAQNGFKAEAAEALGRAVAASQHPPPPGQPTSHEAIQALGQEAAALKARIEARTPAELVGARFFDEAVAPLTGDDSMRGLDFGSQDETSELEEALH